MSKVITANLGKALIIDLTDKCQLGNIPKYVLYHKLCDGRIMGLLVEDLIEYSFANVAKVKNANASVDLIIEYEDEWLPVQCKSSKTEKFCICPSFMKGVGRKFNLKRLYEYLDKFGVFAFAYITEFPVITVTFMPTYWVKANMTITKNDAYIILKGQQHV